MKKVSLADEWKRYFGDYFFLLADARKKLPTVVFAMLVLLAADLVCVGIVGPFASALTTGEAPGFMVGFEQRPRAAFFVLGLVAVTLFVLRGWLGYRLHYAIVRFSEGHHAALTHRLMAAYQAETWEFHSSVKSGVILHRLTWYTQNYTNSTLVASLRFTTDAVVGVAVLSLLLLVDFWSVLVLGAVMATVFVIVQGFVRPRVVETTRGIATHSRRFVRGVQQAIRAHRESRVLGAEGYFLAQVDDATRALVELKSRNQAMLRVPGYSFEATLIAVMVLLGAVTSFREESTAVAVSTLGIFGAAAMRLLSVSTSLAREFNALRAGRFVVTELVRQLRRAGDVREPADDITQASAVEAERTPFEVLELRDVAFTYASTDAPVLRGINLTIRAGQTVGLTGPSGAGKSTLADLMLGFLVPQSGTVRVNGEDVASNLRAWWDRVAYIPQEVYIMDDSVRNNITFGVSQAEVDAQRLNWAINQTQLEAVVASLPEGMNTQVGQDGAKLSGGQRQRIALARALYRRREFIILDEATSALDDETEQAVMAEIIGKTGGAAMLVVAHRESTLGRCERRLEISEGELREVASSDGPSSRSSAGDRERPA